MNPFWVETGNQLRLAIVPRLRGGDWLRDELDQMKRAGRLQVPDTADQVRWVQRFAATRQVP